MFPKLYRGLPVCFCLCAAYVFCVARAADIASDADIALGVSAVNGFGFSLLSQLERTNSTGNVLISPLSISSAVGLTAEGVTADSEALAQLSSVFEGLEFPEDLEFLPSLIRLTVEGSSGVNLTSANSVWLNPEFAEGVKQSFKDNVRQRYGAQIQEFQSGQQVNAWVANVTRGLIDQAVDPSLSPSDVVAMLVNANHFKGLWTVPFETGNTQPGEFFNSNGPATVQMMGQPPSKSDYGYSSLDINGVAVEVVELGFGQASDFSALVILPRMTAEEKAALGAPQPASNRLSEIIDGLAERPQVWGEINAALASTKGAMDVGLRMPRFKAESEFDLMTPFKKMGVTGIFEREAGNFEGMSESLQVYVDKITHKTVLEVNEEGAEAAAVTAFQIVPLSMRPTVVVQVDHPFLFAIQSKKTGMILFAGAMESLA